MSLQSNVEVNERSRKYVTSEQDIIAAYKVFNESWAITPCLRSEAFSQILGYEVYLKDETKQITGSYKMRGAYNALQKLSDEQKKVGVVCASSGNFALALSTFAVRMKIPITVCMALTCPFFKYKSCMQTGANVILHGQSYDDAKHYAQSLAEEKGCPYISGYDNADVIAGHGTIGVEILKQVPDVDTIVAPIGGGGLISGLAIYAKYAKPDVTIIGAQTDICHGMISSLNNKEPSRISIDYKRTIAEGLGVTETCKNTFEIVRDKVDEVFKVSEDIVTYAVLKLFEFEKLLVEGSAAVSLACAISNSLAKSKKVVIILSGSNSDPLTYVKAINRGLACEGRIINFSMAVPSKGNIMLDIYAIFSKYGANVKNSHSLLCTTSSQVFIQKWEGEIEVDNYSKWEKIKAELDDIVDSLTVHTVIPEEIKRINKMFA